VKKHWLLFYDVASDYLERRPQFRAAHLAHAWRAVERGDLVLGGALADPADMAVLLFRAESPEVPTAFAREDPYVLNGLVDAFRVREWTTVIGDDATTPLR